MFASLSQLLYMGRDYPLGYPYFRDRCHRAFAKNREERDATKVATLLRHGHFVVAEMEALYFLKKYRTMKRRYYPEEQVDAQIDAKLKNIRDLEPDDGKKNKNL